MALFSTHPSAAVARALPIEHRSIAGRVTEPLDQVRDDTWGTVIATIATRTEYGRGAGRRILLGLAAANGATGAALLDSDALQQIPPFLYTPGAEVELRGIVRRLPHMTPFLSVVAICPTRRATP